MAKYNLRISIGKAKLLCLCMLFSALSLKAQRNSPVPGTPVTLLNEPQRDTSDKTNTAQWQSERAQIYFARLHASHRLHPDTGLHFFHRRPFEPNWQHNLGNLGSPVVNYLFTPVPRTGPSLGYTAFNIYRFDVDSADYFNTTRPYSSFSYQLGSRAEQMAEILHTQNISPTWNVAARYRKINSPGSYKIQRTNHDLALLTTQYSSRDQHYTLHAAAAYNKIQNDENGGIQSDSFLYLPGFDDRKTIPVNFENASYSNRRSAVTNLQRDFNILLAHSYTVGRTDTFYNEDSTSYRVELVPRFRVAHQFRLGTEKYQFKDLRPDSMRYALIFPYTFSGEDSVFTEQKWVYVDNAIMLSGFVGKRSQALQVSAGAGNRFDKFRTMYAVGDISTDMISNYLVGEISKEALQEGAWSYHAYARIFVSGEAAGNLVLQANAGKSIGKKAALVDAGFEQRINNAPYNFQVYHNQFYEQRKSYEKETVTQVFATLSSPLWHASAGLRNYLIANYIYLDAAGQFQQYADAFNITQVHLQKRFQKGIWVLDNQLVYQQKTGNAPVNFPQFMGRHQLSIETHLFSNALSIATGIDARWHSSFEPAGYAPLFSRFYYQDGYRVSNAPEIAVFFNFRIKNFRAFLMGDQLQTLFTDNIINAPGYPQQNAMIRFGFNWVLIN